MTIPATALPAELPSLLGAALRMLLVLVLVGAVGWLALRWKRRGGGATSNLRVLERAFLTRGASVAVVAVEGRRLLVGVSADGVRLVTDLGVTRSSKTDFAGVLDRAVDEATG